MKYVHWVLQGKGGVGKTFTAFVLHQYFQGKGMEVMGVDTDVVNHSYAAYKQFNVHVLPLLKDEDQIDKEKFDAIVEMVSTMPESTCMVVDSGASTFYPATKYLKQQEIPQMFGEMGVRLMMHTVITGGQALQDTVDGLALVMKFFPGVPIVVWLNHKDGKVTHNGKRFQELEFYRKNEKLIHAVIDLPERDESTFGKNLRELLARNQTFDEALASESELYLMVKHRLKIYWRDIFTVVDAAGLLEGA